MKRRFLNRFTFFKTIELCFILSLSIIGCKLSALPKSLYLHENALKIKMKEYVSIFYLNIQYVNKKLLQFILLTTKGNGMKMTNFGLTLLDLYK